MVDEEKDCLSSAQLIRLAKSLGLPDFIASDAIIGLRQLYRAYRLASDVQLDAWQFAVEVQSLRSLGMTDSEFRWLLCKNFMSQAEETTLPCDRARTFRAIGPLNISDRSCFVLSTSGVYLAQAIDASSHCCAHKSVRMSENVGSGNGRILPNWDSVRHELHWNGSLVKRFKHRSRNQESVLAAFQEEGWPQRVDDPLSPTEDSDPKRRLNDTIKGLNHHQVTNLIRFRGDGTGEGVLWEASLESVSFDR